MVCHSSIQVRPISRLGAPVQRSQHTASYYAASSLPQPDHPVLQGDVVADVCVVGGAHVVRSGLT